MAVYAINIAGAPATINVTLNEQEGPYADGNIQVKDNGADVYDIFGTGSGTAPPIPAGHTISIQQYSNFYSTGTSPSVTMVVVKNGITVFNSTIACIPGNFLTYTDTCNPGDVYDVTDTTTATGDTGYVVINKTGHTMTYNIRPAFGGSITSTGTLADGQFADLLDLLTGGSSSYIDFDAPVTATYGLVFQPTTATSSLGSITSGAIILGMTAADVTTNQGLGYNSTVII